MLILPVLAAILLFRLFRRVHPPADAFVRTAVTGGVLVLALTEALSVVHALTFTGIAVGWAVVVGLLVVALNRWRRQTKPAPGAVRVALWAAVPAGLTLGVTLVIALVAPPNATDAMTYHLARVGQWIQRSSVEPYATSTVRQIFMAPWSEYALLHLQVLAGGSDRLAPALQWLGFAGCLVAGVGIARQLAGAPGAIGLTLLFIATLPMAVVQASSTQTDLVAAFWCALFAWTVLAGRGQSGSASILLPAGALGLAVATKGTAYVVCAPFGVWWVVSRIRAGGWRRAPLHLAMLGGLVLLLNAPLFARNLRLFRHPLGPARQRAELANAGHGLGSLASNLARNATLHLATRSDAWNTALGRAVERAHRLVGLDPQDPRTTWHETQYEVRILRTKESRTGNPLHFLLLGATALVLWLWPNPPVRRHYALAVLAGAVLFCWTFRWQQWNSRLHTPLFVLGAPLAGSALASILSARAQAALGVVLWVASLPWLFANESRPLVSLPGWTAGASILRTPREHQYFVEDPSLEEPYAKVAAELAGTGCGTLGVVGGEQTWLYPLAPLARARGHPLELDYLAVENETRVLEQRRPLCALLVEERDRFGDPVRAGWHPEPPYGGFTRAWGGTRIALWLGYRLPSTGDSAGNRLSTNLREPSTVKWQTSLK